MANKLYSKDEMNFEGISMQEGKSSSTLKLLGFMIVTAIILGILIFSAGSFFASKNEEPDTPKITILPTSSKLEPTEEVIPTVEEKITPSVTPKVTVKPSGTPQVTVSNKKIDLAIEVLNGSGVKGAAGKLANFLESAGYTVISRGNANAFDYTGVTVNIKKSKSTLLNQLEKDLSANDYLVTESTTTYPETSSADVQVILGTTE